MIAERAIPEDARTVPVVGLPLVVAAITGVFFVISVICTAIRVYVNIARRSFGLDDGLVLFSQVIISLFYPPVCCL